MPIRRATALRRLGMVRRRLATVRRLLAIAGRPRILGGPPPGYGGPPGGGNALAQQFAAANVTHNGQLTQAQAAVGGLQIVANNFNSIDLDHKGYVTLPEIQAWLAEQQGRGG